MSLDNLQAALGYTFNDINLLKKALTHSSYAYEHSLGSNACNERLEFLGDAVLELCISEWLYNRHSTMSEGQLTKRRASLVCEPSLAAIARGLYLGDYMQMGHGEDQSGGRDKSSLLSDVLEASLGAVFLDGGLDAAQNVVSHLFESSSGISASLQDNKTTLQEILQKNSRETAVYTIVNESGPPHKRVFVAQVMHRGKILGEGQGGSKKEAEQIAAGKALERI
jgi:ribonuclease-3